MHCSYTKEYLQGGPPTSYTWSYDPNKWPSEWVTGVLPPLYKWMYIPAFITVFRAHLCTTWIQNLSKSLLPHPALWCSTKPSTKRWWIAYTTLRWTANMAWSKTTSKTQICRGICRAPPKTNLHTYTKTVHPLEKDTNSTQRWKEF